MLIKKEQPEVGMFGELDDNEQRRGFAARFRRY